MIDKTARELQALKDARKPFAEALTNLGLMDAFYQPHRRRDRPAARGGSHRLHREHAASGRRQEGVTRRSSTTRSPF